MTQALAWVCAPVRCFAHNARTGYHHDLVGNTSTPPQYDPDTSREAQVSIGARLLRPPRSVQIDISSLQEGS